MNPILVISCSEIYRVGEDLILMRNSFIYIYNFYKMVKVLF